ncbi:malonate decarboxylase holo-[acyl-carrier-protein] synthase [Tardiphaga sp. 768_D3_N2_1]|uniref:malonate decarboxylase holo-[acyl-carrier-protein] synthase n=1 Tax=Tardiphaga sp. 768_D3_N2_1 TaxID=3240783 RepID=UPI003F89C15C
MHLDRHQIVHIDPAAWPALVDAQPNLKAIAAIEEWAILGRPLIARRRLCSDVAGRVPLGLPLPPSMGKQRLAFTVASEVVTSTSLPPLLADAIPFAPVAWRSTLAALVALEPDVRCFGSLAWEYLTNLPYVSATSDVDLLWQVLTTRDADALVAAIAPIEASAPMGIDGELVTPSGLAIQWREWASGASDVLVKARDRNQMIPRQSVFA